jgi:hypothetical protein
MSAVASTAAAVSLAMGLAMPSALARSVGIGLLLRVTVQLNSSGA